jgi:hypothetical protein
MSGVIESEKFYIPCVGVDEKIHVCEAHKTTTKCGVKVISKEVTPKDRTNYFSCYECTF